MPKFPAHVWILLALIAGAAVGAAISVWWDTETWRAMGVENAKAFLSHTAPAADAPPLGDPSPLAHAVRFAGEAARFIGDLFLRLLRLIAVPVVLFSLAAAVAGVGNARTLGRVGGKTLLVFACTAVAAVFIAVALSLSVRPGRFVNETTRDAVLAERAKDAAGRVGDAEKFGASTSLWGQILDAFPANPFRALADGNMMQIVTMAILLGVGLTLVSEERRREAVRVLEALAEACLQVVLVVMKFAPVAVFCLTAIVVATMGWSVLGALAVFVVTVLAGLGIILFGVYPAMVTLFSKPRMSIGKFFRGMAPAQLLAFSSSSSAATMPVTMRCCRALGVSDRVTNLVCPLGTTVNMDGTALYQVMCVTFLAQVFGVPLGVGEYVTICAMAILVAIGSPGLPSASLVLMVFILEAVGIPTAGLALIIAVDRILDMARTVVNVTGDTAAAVVVASGEGELSPVGARPAPG